MDKNEETGLTYSVFEIFVNSLLVTEFRLMIKIVHIYISISVQLSSDAEIFYLKYFFFNELLVSSKSVRLKKIK